MLMELIRRDVRSLWEMSPLLIAAAVIAVCAGVPAMIAVDLPKESYMLSIALFAVAAAVFLLGLVILRRVMRAIGCCVDEKIRADGTEEEKRQLAEICEKLKGRYEHESDHIADRRARRKIRVRFMRRTKKCSSK
jgi:hypothetical protein